MWQVYALLSQIKITELLLEVDDWTGFTRTLNTLKARRCQKIVSCCSRQHGMRQAGQTEGKAKLFEESGSEEIDADDAADHVESRHGFDR